MSQRNVERVIGRLVTDEAFRRRFAENSEATLLDATACGLELSECERHALRSIDLRLVSRLARALDPRLQKTDITGGSH